MRTNNKGFIQIPLLLLILAGIAVVGGGSYFVAREIKKSPANHNQQTASVASVFTDEQQVLNGENTPTPQQTETANQESEIQSQTKTTSTGNSSAKTTNTSAQKQTAQQQQQSQPAQNQVSNTQQTAPTQPSQSAPTTPTPTQTTQQPSQPSQNQTQPTVKVSISLTSQDIGETTARIEWTTSEPTESKLYLSGGGITSQQYASQNGYTTKHIVTLSNLQPTTDYSFQITATGNGGFADYTGGFKTKTPSPTLQLSGETNIPLEGNGYKLTWTSANTKQCMASGDWSGNKAASGEYTLSYSQAGNYTYTLNCTGDNGENINKSIAVKVFESTPRITVAVSVGTPSGAVTIGATEQQIFKLSLQQTSGSNCQVSNIKVRLVGGNSLVKNSIRAGNGTGYFPSPSGVDGNVLDYEISGTGTYCNTTFTFKTDVPETATPGETFHLEFVSLKARDTVSGSDAIVSGSVVGGEFTIVQNQ
ncbi:MAG: fibronectin type III domain-containing protein [Candidatus Pacebacteria bacterium]|nr:fibronectin type III domain-containing protein [Candidatus Paceibacterota bacterium]